jgi:predicted Holliday junction resolvase-like endonuclease
VAVFLIEIFAILFLIFRIYRYQHTIQENKKEITLAKQKLQESAHRAELLSARLQTETHTVNQLQSSIANAESTYQEKLEIWKAQEESLIRKDALDRSRATMRGQATEHLAPYMIEGLNPKDFRFMGDPVDYLVCVGSSAIKDKQSDIIEYVMLLDIKTGKSQLNKTQRRVRDAIVGSRIVFATYNPDTQELREWKPKSQLLETPTGTLKSISKTS